MRTKNRSRSQSTASTESDVSVRSGAASTALRGEVAIKLMARVCKSVMHVDVAEKELTFEDCVANRVYNAEVTVWNNSEVALEFALDRGIQRHANLLKFTHLDSDEPFHMHTVPGFMNERLQIRFMPKTSGELNHTVILNNINDSSNAVPIKIYANVREAVQQELLRVVESYVNFGDCFADCPYVEEISVWNVSEEPMELDLRRGARDEISFHTTQHGRTRQISEAESSPEKGAPGRDAAGKLAYGKQTQQTNQGANKKNAEGMGGESMCTELSLAPGRSRRLKIVYKPNRSRLPTEVERASLLTRNSFHVQIYANDMEGRLLQQRTLHFQSRVCLSVVQLSTHSINFGDVKVGLKQSEVFQVRNLSDLPADISVKTGSRIITITPTKFTIPPRQRRDINVDITPVSVDVVFENTIEVINHQNRNNDQKVAVQSTNVESTVEMESLFAVGCSRPQQRKRGKANKHYNWTSNDDPQNTLAFGDVVVNSPTVQRFWIKNTAVGKIKLQLEALHEGMQLYCISSEGEEADPTPAVLTAENRRSSLVAEEAQNKKDKHDKLVALEKKDHHERLVQSIQHQFSGNKRRTGSDAAPEWLDLAILQSSRSKSHEKTANTLTVGSNLPLVPQADLRGMSNENLSEISSGSGSDDDAANTPAKSASLQANLIPPFRRKSNRDGMTFQRQRRDSDRPRLATTKVTNKGATSTRKTSSEPTEADVLSPEPEPSTIRQKLEHSLEALEKFTLQVFPTAQDEEQFVFDRIEAQRNLQKAITRERLKNVSEIEVLPEERVTVYAVLTPKMDNAKHGGRRRVKDQGTIRITMASLDGVAVSTGSSQSAVHTLKTKFNLCTSKLQVPQKHINFGVLRSNTTRNNILVLNNTSDVPLMYHIQKTGSVASGLFFSEGLAGMIRPYKTKEVPFTFKPGMAGKVAEQVTIKNVLDPDNVEVIQFRAMVKAPQTFTVTPEEIDFGAVVVERYVSTSCECVIANTSFRARDFSVTLDKSSHRFKKFKVNAFMETLGGESVILSKETNDEIEKQEQRLKIATRKGQLKKLEKITEKLRRLRSGVPKNDLSMSESDVSDDEDVYSEAKGMNKFAVSLQGRRRRKFKVLLMAETLTDANLPNEFERGELVLKVHEVNNKEVFKTILVKVCIWQSIVLLERAREQKRTSSPVMPRSPSPLPPPPRAAEKQASEADASSSSDLRPLANPDRCGWGEIQRDLSRPKQASEDTFSVSPANVDVGAIEMGQTVLKTVIVKNLSNKGIVFGLFDVRQADNDTDQSDPKTRGKVTDTLRFNQYNGQVAAGSEQELTLTITAVSPGRQQFHATVRDVGARNQTKDVVVTMFVKGAQYLRFPEFEEQKDVNIQLGNCYWHSTEEYIKVTRLVVENLHSKPLQVFSSSNLPKQVFIFTDEDLTSMCPTCTLQLEPHSCGIFFVCLKPHMPENSLRSGQCRQMEGGIQIWASEAGAGKKKAILVKHTVKFSAVVGRSVMKISKKVIKLDSHAVVGKEFCASFIVRNQSTHLPLDFSVKAPPEVSLNTTEQILPAGETATMTFKCFSRHFGIHRHSIYVVNKHDPKHPVEVVLLIYVDADNLRSDLPHDDDSVVRHIDFALVYISTADASRMCFDNRGRFTLEDLYKLESGGAESNYAKATMIGKHEFTLQNMLDIEMQLVPKSDSHVRVTYISMQMPDGTVVSMDAEMVDPVKIPLKKLLTQSKWATYTCGPVLTLPPRAKCTVLVACPLPSTLSSRKIDALREGKISNLIGSLHFQRRVANIDAADAALPLSSAGPSEPLGISTTPLPGTLESGSSSPPRMPVRGSVTSIHVYDRVVKVFDIRAKFCLSIAAVVGSSDINLGPIGYLNHWRPKTFNFKIVNTSDSLVLLAMDELPPLIELLCVRKSTRATCESHKHEIPLADQHLSLEPKQTAHFFGHAVSREDDSDSGPTEAVLKIRNILNAHNTLSITLNMTKTTFGLNFLKLDNNCELQLPVLSYPVATPCERWFSVSWSGHDGTESGPEKSGVAAADADETDPSQFMIYTTLDKQFADVISIQIMTRYSNSSVSELIMSDEGQTKDLRIRVKLQKNSERAERLRTTDTNLLFGHVCSRAMLRDDTKTLPASTKNLPVKRIPIYGSITEVHALEVSSTHLNLFSTRNRAEMTTGAENEGDSDDTNSESEDDSSSANDLSDGFSSDQRGTAALKESQRRKKGKGNMDAVFKVSNISISPVVFNITQHAGLDKLDGSTNPGDSIDDLLKITPSNGTINPRGSIEVRVQLSPDHLLDAGRLDTARLLSVHDTLAPADFVHEVEVEIVAQHNSVLRRQLNRQRRDKVPERKRGSDSSLPPGMGLSPSRGSLSVPLIEISGCTPVDALVALPTLDGSSSDSGNSRGKTATYEIDLGQRHAQSGKVRWEITLENSSVAVPVRYKLYTAREEDLSWLQPSKSGGILHPASSGRGSIQTVTLSLSTVVPQTAVAYLIVENLDQPTDIKIIRVKMDVVTDFESQTHHMRVSDGRQAFGLTVSEHARKFHPFFASTSLTVAGASAGFASSKGSEANGSAGGAERASAKHIMLGDLVEGVVSSEHSFVVVNKSLTTLDFALRHNLDPGPVELNFAVTLCDPPSFVHSLLIPPGESRRVFLILVVSDDEQMIRLGQKSKATWFSRSNTVSPDSSLNLTSQASIGSPPVSPASDAVVPAGSNTGGTKLTADGVGPVAVFISCRAIRNCQRTIHLHGNIFPRAFSLDCSALSFRVANIGEMSKHAQDGQPASRLDPQFVPQSAAVRVKSANSAPLKINVQKHMRYFNVEQQPGVDGGVSFCDLVLTPNCQAIKAHMAQLLRYRYIHERVTVYNRSRASEKVHVSVVLSLGHFVQCRPAPRLGLVHRSVAAVEAQISTLVVQFRSALYSDVSSWADAGAHEDLLFKFVIIIDELISMALMMTGSRSGLQFGVHLAHVLFAVVFKSPVFTQHAPARLCAPPSGVAEDAEASAATNGGGGAGAGAALDRNDSDLSISSRAEFTNAEWPEHLRAWLIQFLRFITIFSAVENVEPLTELYGASTAPRCAAFLVRSDWACVPPIPCPPPRPRRGLPCLLGSLSCASRLIG